MIIVVDNYDSFVFNIARYLRELGCTVTVVRNDAVDVAGLAAMQPAAIVLSPGPCTPAEAGISRDVVRAFSGQVPLLGIGVRAPKAKQEENVFALAERTAAKLGCPGVVQRDDVVADSNYVGRGYGIPGPDTLEAIRLFAELEGILLDPVYSGKGAAGLIDYVRKGIFKKGERIVFLHTGGSAALFGYDACFADDQPAHAMA